MKRLLLAISLLAALAVPATASATYSVTYDAPSDTVIVSPGDSASVQAQYGFCFLFCGPQPMTVSSSSSTPMNNNTGGHCGGANGATSFTCPAGAAVRENGTASADTFDGFCLFGGAAPVFVGGDGADKVTMFFCAGGSVDLGPGDDTATGAQVVNGGDGNDVITGSPGNDSLDGGSGRDTISGGDGDDALQGGDGRDLLLPGPGKDTISGGPSVDAVSYEDHNGVSISLNDAADDGAAGEQDNLADDVENVIGSAGEDTITGNGNRNDIDAGAGGDVIDPGGDSDFVDAGPGNDRILTRDGSIDRIECGDGNDQAVIDAFDVVTNCEDVQASRELMPDVDNDGVPAPADCDDHNPAVRPGIPDKPQNGVDDDCANGDAPFPRIVTGVQTGFVAGSTTRVTRLRAIDVPAGARTEVRCRGGKKKHCFKDVKRRSFPTGAGEANLRRPFKKRRLKPGAVIDVRILATDSIGKVVRYKIRRNALPKTTLLCLVPGQNAPGKCH
jgi:Ca2+-binding RTX toxin-like protein